MKLRLYLIANTLLIQYKKVGGHAGHEFNERCDRLAVAAYKKEELIAEVNALLHTNNKQVD